MPEWLPAKAPVNPWTQNTYEILYEIFCRDIRDIDLHYNGNHVWIFKELEDGKEKIFWHLTTRKTKPDRVPRRKKRFYTADQKDTMEIERLPDLRRCERLPWVKPLIEHPSDPEVLAWDYEEGDRTIRTYVWVKEYDFVVIMKSYSNGKRRLITSFYVDEQYKRNDFERKYMGRIK
jgi:hypothetical protein